MDDICVVHIGWIKGGIAIQSPFASPMDAEGFLLFQMDTTSARRFTAKKKAVLIIKKENSDEGTGKDLQSGGN